MCPFDPNTTQELKGSVERKTKSLQSLLSLTVHNTWISSPGGVNQGAGEGVQPLDQPTQPPAALQLHVDLPPLLQRQQHRLHAAVLRVLPVVLPGGRHQLSVSHELHLVVHPHALAARPGVDREGEGVQSRTRSRKNTCQRTFFFLK